MPADYESAHTSLLPIGVDANVSANATTYCGTQRDSVNNALAQFPVSEDGVLEGLYARMSAVPGVGESCVYTLMVNNVATALTCTIADLNNAANDEVNSVAVSRGDLISLRLVTSLNCVVTGHGMCMRFRS